MEQKEVRSLRERVGLAVMSVSPTKPAALVELLVELEEVEIEQIWVSGPPTQPDLFTTLAAAATRTTHLKFGTAVVQVFAHHPVLLARQALSLNALAPGRLRLGIGTGVPAFAKRMYSIEMEKPLAYLREYIQVLRPLLQDGEVQHQGRYFTLDIKLSASSQVPLLVGTLGQKTFRLAGEIADGALPYLCPLPYLRETALSALSAGAAVAGRSRPPLTAHVPVALTEERALALQAGRRAMSFYTTLPTCRNMFIAAGYTQQEIDTVSDSFVESLLVFGDEVKVRDRLLELLSSGFDELMIEPIPVSDAAQEEKRLARLIGQL